MSDLKQELSKSPRVEACIDAVMARFHGESKAALARYYEEVHQHLAPLARDLEVELAAAKEEIASSVDGAYELVARLRKQVDDLQGKLSDTESRRTQPEATAPAPEQRIADALAELASAQKPLDADVSKIIFDNMWALYGDDFGAKVTPAQDLGAAILEIPLPDPAWIQHGPFSNRDLFTTEQIRDLLKAASALASSANALSAGDSEKLAQVREAILTYYDALSARQHGGAAQDKAFYAIQDALGMSWQSGVDHRAILQSQKDGHG